MIFISKPSIISYYNHERDGKSGFLPTLSYCLDVYILRFMSNYKIRKDDSMNKKQIVENVENYLEPILEELQLALVDVEYVKEGPNYYLRIYIDKEGGISLTDCESLSRRVSDIMDEEDPISVAYFLEVSSPGLNRGLFTDDHYKKQIGKEVLIRFTKSLDGRKNVKGILKEVKENSVVVEADTLVEVPKDKIKSANLEGEI